MAIISKKEANAIADSLEEYLHIISTSVIVEGASKKLIDDSKAVIKKGIKNLRKGNVEKVIDLERYALMKEFYEENGFPRE